MNEVSTGFIRDCIDKKTKVVVYTTNGFMLHGEIKKQDTLAIVINSHSNKGQNTLVDKLVFKNAISTIEPIMK